LRRSGGTLQGRVTDRGPGLPEAVRKQLFAPCQSSREGGTGIGLAISRQLAHHLGAALRLDNSSAAGTSFVLEVPLREAVTNSPLDESVLQS
jgi:C4-dicarboxylate-specific signal transduction histidine kinase